MAHSFNEAELQAGLESQLRKALPLLPLRIRLERYLRLRLGHRTLTIDGLQSDETGLQGRYDVLILVDEQPTLIAELKAPGLGVTEDDVQQALSYARSHIPLVPLVLVTDGTTTWLRRTYDGAPLPPEDMAGERLAATLKAASQTAASDTQDAIRTLLGASPQVLKALFSAWTAETITAITGKLRDFRFPIVSGFSFPRRVVSELADLLAQGQRLVILHGPPLCGITNVLTQLSSNHSEPLLFLDQSASDPLQSIANRLSRELSFGVSKNEIRTWLNTRSGLHDITLVMDGLPKDGLDELVEYAKAGLLRLVIGMDTEALRRLSNMPGRSQSSALGRLATLVELEPLSDEEFYESCVVLATSLGAAFFHGAQHASELRWPRRLRVLAATLPPPSTEKIAERTTLTMVLPVPGVPLLSACHDAFVAGPESKQDWQLLADVFLHEVEGCIDDVNWLMAIWGRPSLSPALVEEVLGEPRLTRLCEQGYLSWIDDQTLGPRLLLRMEELLAFYVGKQWTTQLARLSDSQTIGDELTKLIHLSTAVPEGEVAVAFAIIRATEQNAEVLNVAIPYLWERKPTTSKFVAGSQFELMTTDARVLIECGEGAEEEVVGDIQPWVVLSYLAAVPMMAADHDGSTVNAGIFAEMGASPHLLYQPRPCKLAAVPAFHFHDLPGLGSILCLKTGIVEPLLQAMLSHAHHFPDELIALAGHALKERKVHLAWRLLTVALASEDSTDEQVQRASSQVKRVLQDWWGAALQELVRRHQLPSDGAQP